VTIAERISPAITLAVGGKSWRLLFTTSVLLDIERATGLRVLVGEFQPDRASARDLRAALHALLVRAGATFTCCEVGKWLGLRTVPRAREAMAQAWITSMPEPKPATAHKDPLASKPPLSWPEAWAIADQDLGLSAEEWLDLTPRMVESLNQQRLESLRNWELMISQVIAANVNFGFNPPRRPLKPESFMLHPWPKGEEAESIGDQIMQEMKRLKQ